MKKLFTLFLTALLTMAFTLVTNANSLAAKDYLDFNEGLYCSQTICRKSNW